MERISMRVLTFTNLYPNPEQPERGKFISQMVDALPSEIKSVVVSPLPWCPPISIGNSDKLVFSRIPYSASVNGIESYYPKYFMVPKVSSLFHAASILIFSFSIVNYLKKRHAVDLVHAHYLYPDCVAAVLIAKWLSIPIVVSARGSDINIFGGYKCCMPQIRWALHQANIVTAVSDAMRSKIINDYGVNGNKVKTIRNGVDSAVIKKIERKRARSILELNPSEKYLLFVGHLQKVKGLSYLIESLKILKDSGNLNFKTLLVGEGVERKQIEKKIAKFHLQKYVILIGNKPHEEVFLWMSASDVLCLPSIQEGTPNVVLEALVCDLPIVASNVGGIPEVVDRSNSILVPPKDSKTLAGAILQGFKLKWLNQKKMNYSWHDCAQKYADLYFRLVRE